MRSNLTGVNHKSFRGFTLIELLVVIAMIGVMISLLLIFIDPFKQIKKGRDAQRQADLSQVRQALDTYYNDKNCFPNSVPFGSALEIGSTVYMKKVPQDPDCASGGSCYQYLKDTASCPQWNVLFSKAASNPNAVSCALQQIPSCLPSNYYASGYASCVISGTVNCAAIASMSIPTSGGSQVVPTTTIAPTLPPLPTSTPTPTSAPVPTPTVTPTPTPVSALTYNQTILNTPGLVSYWRLGESSGNPQDSKGTNHATVVGGTPTYGQTGAIVGDSNTAIAFDGSTEYFSVPDSASLDLGDGPMSLEAWTKRSVVDTAQHQIISKGTNAYDWSITNNRNRSAKGNVSEIAQSNTSLTANTWHHLVMTKNGATTKLYVDGADSTGTVSNATLSNTVDALSLGRFGSGYYFNGSLDEVAIYNAVLSASTVLAHYNAGIGGAAVSPTPTITSGAFTISGNVYIDTNKNGAQDVGEANASGRIVSLAGVGTRTTDINGNYSFTGITAGSYTVTLTVPAGNSATTTNPRTVILGPSTTVNFGYAPTTSSSVTVSSIVALKTALLDNSLDEIVVVNGTYAVRGATSQASNSLWIGSAYAGRTRPILIRAQTTGGVIFDGGGARWWMGLGFMEGAHDQTWQGFTFANAEPTSTGVIAFGGYLDRPGAHHITLRNITMARSLVSQSGPGVYLDHALYFSESSDGTHDVLIDGWTVNGAGLASDLDSGIQFYSEPGRINARNVTIRNVKITGTEMAIILWSNVLDNIVIEDATVTNATRFAVRYEGPGTNITLRRVVSTGSGMRGFYSSLGTNPPGLTFVSSSLN